MKFTTALAVLLSTSFTVFAAQAGFTARGIWVPSITYPTTGTAWTAGKTYKVEWSLDQKPSDASNQFGALYLLKGGRGNPDKPLVDGLLLSVGFAFVNITMTTLAIGDSAMRNSDATGTPASYTSSSVLPTSSSSTSTTAGKDYQIILLTGGSLGASPTFQINY